MRRFILPFIVSLAGAAAHADAPVIESATLSGARLSVTLSHPDTGWAHYANAWQVFAPDGSEIAVRPLAHPHVEEQPFTRSLGLPDLQSLAYITITATCTLGHTSAPYRLKLTE